jgi:transposase
LVRNAPQSGRNPSAVSSRVSREPAPALVASFANGVIKDQAAVSAAITSPWSNGQTEGQITKLKLVKRQMYGCGKLDLLQARVIGCG